MSEPHACCRTPPTASQGEEGRCPVCKGLGTPVGTVTLRAQLQPCLVDHVKDASYRFCGSTDCQVVYFLPGSVQTFVRVDLTIRVGIKETHAPHPICYCFGHTQESLREAWVSTGKDEAVAAIHIAVKAGTCRCETTNPQGRCCLGELQKFMKAMAVSGKGDLR